MKVLNVDQTIDFILNWIKYNGEKIWKIWLQKGGWEVWAQVEMMATLIFDNDVSVQREIAIFEDNRMAVDLVVNFNQQEITRQICLELKCESLFQSARDGRVKTHHKIWEKVQADIDKLEEERDDAYDNAQALAVAIVFSPQAYESLENLGLTMVKINLGPGPGGENRYVALGFKVC